MPGEFLHPAYAPVGAKGNDDMVVMMAYFA